MSVKARSVIAAILSAIVGTAVFYATCLLFPLLYNLLGFTGFTVSVTLVSFALSVIYYLAELFLEKKKILGKYILPVCAVVLPLVLAFAFEGICYVSSDNMFNGMYVPIFLFFSQLGYVFMIIFRVFYQIILHIGSTKANGDEKK